MIATLSFLLKISITAISFYWLNDTPSFVTWQSRLATAPDTLRRMVIHGGQFTGGVHPPPISSSLRLFCLVRPNLFVIITIHVFKEVISFIGSLDKWHTSVFNALISSWCLKFSEDFCIKMSFYMYVSSCWTEMIQFDWLVKINRIVCKRTRKSIKEHKLINIRRTKENQGESKKNIR